MDKKREVTIKVENLTIVRILFLIFMGVVAFCKEVFQYPAKLGKSRKVLDTSIVLWILSEPFIDMISPSFTKELLW